MNTRYLPTIFFGILCIKLIASSANSKGEICYKTKDKQICYLRESKVIHTWNDAKNICDSKNLTLPSFTSKAEKETFTSYLSYLKDLEFEEVENFRFWSAGRRIVYDNWTWINDQIWNNNIPIHSENNGSHVVAAANGSALAQDPSRPTLYLCQYSGDWCKKGEGFSRVIPLRETCVIGSIEKRTWYKARNDCLNRGGDLAFIDSEDAQTLLRFARKALIEPHTTYWIGLRKVYWVWITHVQGIKGRSEQVKFTDWSDQTQFHSSGDVCIYVDASDGKWRTSDCSIAMSVICQRKEVIDDDSTERKENLPSGLAQYVTIGSVIAVAGIICGTSIAIAVFVAKRKAHVGRRRETLVEGNYQDLKRMRSIAVSEAVDDYESIGHEDEQAFEAADNCESIGQEDKHCENKAYLFLNPGYGSDVQHLKDTGKDKELKK